jgi:ABC-type bacteriocin/lantibiotic exporter with double-glycine peptidase domain
MTYNDWKKFTSYFFKNYKSSEALKEFGKFILTIISIIIIGVVMGLLLNYSWWLAIPIVLFILLAFYVSMVWIEWKFVK